MFAVSIILYSTMLPRAIRQSYAGPIQANAAGRAQLSSNIRDLLAPSPWARKHSLTHPDHVHRLACDTPFTRATTAARAQTDYLIYPTFSNRCILTNHHVPRTHLGGGVDILNLPSSLGVGDAISPHVTSPFSNNYIYICVCMSGTVQWSSTVACITSHLPPYLRWVSGISSPELSSPLTSTLSLLRIAQLSALSLSRFLLSNVPTYNIALTLCNTPSGTEAMETGSWSNPRSSSSPRRRTRSGNYYTVQILRFAGIWFLTSSGEVSSVVGSCADKYCEARGEDEAVERELRAEYTCPFCAEDFDVVGLSCHMDEEHPSAVKSGVRFSALGLLIVHCCTLPWFAMKLNVDP